MNQDLTRNELKFNQKLTESELKLNQELGTSSLMNIHIIELRNVSIRDN